MLAPIKVAVVGVGALGEHHARIYSELSEAELVAVVDTQEDRAQRLADLCSCRFYSDYREIFGAVDAVSLVVPTAEHARIGVDLLKKGMHVLVEKPIAQSTAEADLLIQAQKENGAVLHVGQSERFNPALLAVQPFISEPRFFESHRLGVFVPRSLDIDVVLDLMIHDLDLILHFVKSPIREIRAVGIPVLSSRVDIANARLEFENGCVANVTASRVSTEKIRKLRLFQEEGYVSIDFHKQRAEIHQLREATEGKQIGQQELSIQQEQPLRLEIQAFLRAVNKEDEHPSLPTGCPAEEGQRTLDLALKVNEAIEKGREKRPDNS